jgi:hypothetical protein
MTPCLAIVFVPCCSFCSPKQELAYRCRHAKSTDRGRCGLTASLHLCSTYLIFSHINKTCLQDVLSLTSSTLFQHRTGTSHQRQHTENYVLRARTHGHGMPVRPIRSVTAVPLAFHANRRKRVSDIHSLHQRSL